MIEATLPKRTVLRSLDPFDRDEPLLMKFRLTYEGVLRSSQPENPCYPSKKQIKLADHKQEIRKQFHLQLKMLLSLSPVLRNLKYCKDCGFNHQPIHHPSSFGLGGHRLESVQSFLEGQFQRHGYNFVPLVTKDFGLLCSLDILFLRQDAPGCIFNNAGDIDNRVKTIIDALKMPRTANELGQYIAPGEGEDPFFCLLEDDRQVSGFAVETDMLLTPGQSSDPDGRDAKIVIDVELRPYDPTHFNLAFA